MVGNAFTFDGEEDYVLIPPSEDLPHGSDARTIEMWVYSKSASWQSDRRTLFIIKGWGSFMNRLGLIFILILRYNSIHGKMICIFQLLFQKPVGFMSQWSMTEVTFSPHILMAH